MLFQENHSAPQFQEVWLFCTCSLIYIFKFSEYVNKVVALLQVAVNCKENDKYYLIWHQIKRPIHHNLYIVIFSVLFFRCQFVENFLSFFYEIRSQVCNLCLIWLLISGGMLALFYVTNPSQCFPIIGYIAFQRLVPCQYTEKHTKWRVFEVCWSSQNVN